MSTSKGASGYFHYIKKRIGLQLIYTISNQNPTLVYIKIPNIPLPYCGGLCPHDPQPII
jgi:hypothetical protein